MWSSPPSPLLPAVSCWDSGDIDCVLATFTITDERKETWDFTTPYYTDAVTVLVEDSSGISSLSDLVGKTVGVSFRFHFRP